MKKDLNYLVFASLCLFEIVFCLQVHAQSVVVHGTMSTSTTPVRYATVTFVEKNDPTNTFSAVTASLGQARDSLQTAIEGLVKVSVDVKVANADNPTVFYSIRTIRTRLIRQLQSAISCQ